MSDRTKSSQMYSRCPAPTESFRRDVVMLLSGTDVGHLKADGVAAPGPRYVTRGLRVDSPAVASVGAGDCSPSAVTMKYGRDQAIGCCGRAA